jgi:hypothetical protein
VSYKIKKITIQGQRPLYQIYDTINDRVISECHSRYKALEELKAYIDSEEELVDLFDRSYDLLDRYKE